jgi:predicted transcriptional regulator
MEISLTPEQESQLKRPAAHLGKDPGRMVIDAALCIFDEDNRFRAAVQKGIEQADRGEFIEEEEMDARVARMLQR